MSSEDYEPNITLNIQLNELSPEFKQVLFIFFVLLINVNVFLCLLNLRYFIVNTYKSLQFIVNKRANYTGYHILSDTENSV